METYTNDKDIFLLSVLVLVILFFLFKEGFVGAQRRFTRRRNYYKIEIERAESEEERKKWESRLRQLYRDRIPIFNRKNRYAIKGFFHFLKKKFRKKDKDDEEEHRHHHHHHHHHHHSDHHGDHHEEHHHHHSDDTIE